MLGPGRYNLEEFERESFGSRDVWSITLSFPRDPITTSTLAQFAQLTADLLEYKRFLIDVKSGELVAMKLREPALR